MAKYSGFIILIGALILVFLLNIYFNVKKEEKKSAVPSAGYGAVIYKGYEPFTKDHLISFINDDGIATIKDKRLWGKAGVGDSIKITYHKDGGIFESLIFVDIEVIGKSVGDYSDISVGGKTTETIMGGGIPVTIPKK